MKPTAWINEYDGLEPFNPNNRQDWIPLYTHPAKTLTDEEIMNIFNNWVNSKQEHNLPTRNINYFYQEMLEFARAILRKAQE
jgi:hypothetical protein